MSVPDITCMLAPCIPSFSAVIGISLVGSFPLSNAAVCRGFTEYGVQAGCRVQGPGNGNGTSQIDPSGEGGGRRRVRGRLDMDG